MAFVVGIIGLAVAIVGIGLSTWQTVEARNRAADEADAMAEQKDKEALAAQQSAAFAEQQHRRRIALLAGRTEAITAASGVSTLSQSATAVESDLTIQGELEALNIRRGGQVESQAKDFEARLSRYRASTQRGLIGYDIAGGVLSAASSGIDTYSSVKGYNVRNYYGRGRTFTSPGAGYSAQG